MSAGTVAEIWRYPVKSMRGERIDRAEFRWTGIAGDRQFAFLRADDRSRFPWLTGRVLPELVLYRACFDDPEDPRNSPVSVIAPDGQSFGFWDPALAQGLGDIAGEPALPMRLGRGAFDQHPVSVVTTATLRRLSSIAGSYIDPRRFRINIVIEETETAPPENDWVGRTLGFGHEAKAPALRIDEAAERCVMVTIDPETGKRDPGVMRLVAQNFANRIGLYCAPVALGRISVGDPVTLA